MTRRILIFAYGVVAYVMFLGVFLYAVGFLGNFATPTALDAAPTAPLGRALLVDLLLLAVFAVQHSVMARPAFKRWWTRIIPAEAERSTYVLLSNLCMVALFAFWQPLGGEIWTLDGAARTAVLALYALGWMIVLVSTLLIDHFDLFGLRQVWLALRGREYSSPEFQMHTLYRFVRHPIYVGWITLFWATPTMTFSHLLFAVGTTAYILVAIPLEERDLLAHHGRCYAAYRRHVPMIVPSLSPRSLPETTSTGSFPVA